MLSLYQQVRDLFVGGSANGATIDNDRRDHPRLQTHGETSASIRTEQRRCFTGTVTAVNEDDGMIDNHVYFDFDCIIGGKLPLVGGAAHVIATRAHVHAGWRAVQVDLMCEWRPEESSETELIVGVVSGISATKCVVESGSREVTFVPGEHQPGNRYRPQVGDSIEVELLHQDGEVKVQGLKPLREQTLTGTVTRVSHGNGVIEDDIFFTMSSCCRGYRPSVGDDVSVVCVECVRHNCNWRAYSVEPSRPNSEINPDSASSDSDSSFRLPSIPLLKSKFPILDLPSGNCPELEYMPQPRSTRKKHVIPKTSYHTRVTSCRIPGQRPQRGPMLKLPNHLGEYPVPDGLRKVVEGGERREMSLTEPVIEEPLCMDNYCQKLGTLLFIEEIQREIDIRQFDLSQVVLDRCGAYFSLSVPGLSEGRPSLLMGDKVIVWNHGNDISVTFLR